MPAMLPVRALGGASRQGRVADYIPLLSVIDEDSGELLMKDGSLAMVFKLRGSDAETMTTEEKNAQVVALYDLLKHCDSRIMLWVTVMRRRVRRDYRHEFSAAAPQMAHDAYIRQFERASAYDNDVFLTLVYLGDLRGQGLFDRISFYSQSGRTLPVSAALAVRDGFSVKRLYRHNEATFAAAREAFAQITADFAAGFGQLGAAPLTGDDIYGFFHGCANPGCTSGGGVRAPSSPATPDCGWLATSEVERVGRGFAPNTLRFTHAGNDMQFCTALAVHEWAEAMFAGGLDDLLSAPGEITLTAVCAFMDDEQAQKMLSGLENKIAMSFEKFSQLISRAIKKGGDEGGSGMGRSMLAHEVREANARTFKDRLKWAHVYVSILCLGDSAEAAGALSTEVASICRRSRLMVRQETLHLLQAWSASMPGQWGEIVGWWPLPVDYLSAVVPLRSLNAGIAENPHFTKIRGRRSPALSVFRTERGGDYFLDLHAGSAGRLDGDIGHFACIAPTARGKTVLVNWLIYQFRKYDPTRIIVLDKDLSCKIPILLQGGEYMQTGRDSSAGGNTPLSLNPLALLESVEHDAFLTGWIWRLLELEGCRDVPQDEIARALNLLRGHEREHWRLGGLATLLPPSASDALKPWLDGGTYGDLDNAGDDGFMRQMRADSYCIGVDLKRVFEDNHFATPCLDYLLYAIEQATSYGAAGAAVRPGLLYIEESWKALSIPRLASQLEDWLRTLRKKNFAVGITTQSLRDLEKSGLFSILIDSIPNKFMLGNPEAGSQKELYAVFGLNDQDTEALSQMMTGQFFYVKSSVVKKRLRFKLPPQALRLLEVNESALARFDEMGKDKYLQSIEAMQ